jgi:tRNA (guanosine-2'-O-)-methyltransferase
MRKSITEHRKQRLTQVLSHKQPQLTVVCENIHDSHNVSAIVRTCDAVGVDTLHLVYTNECFPDIGKKSSGGLKKWMRFIHHESPERCVNLLHQQGFTILATTLEQDPTDLYAMDYCIPTAIVVGNEHRGVSKPWLSLADSLIKIPMMGLAQSLNVSVATAVILYEALRQRRNNGLYDQIQYPPNTLKELKHQWFQK